MNSTSGEIYRQIRLSHRNENRETEERWKALLSSSQLASLRKACEQDFLLEAFDWLLDIPGLWDGMRLSVVHKLIAMKCDEVSSLPSWRFITNEG
jgi:hypothetical protein